MASEDSDQVMPGFLAVHGLRDLDDLDQTLRGQVPADGDDLHAAGKSLKVVALRRHERVRLEKRNDHIQELRAILHAILQEVLAVVVMPCVSIDPADPKEAVKIFEAGAARFALRDSEAMGHLIAGRVAASARAIRLPHEAD